MPECRAESNARRRVEELGFDSRALYACTITFKREQNSENNGAPDSLPAVG